jgi:hypothetical protein
MIRPTTIPQTLDDLKIEQALAREALNLSFIQHKEFAVSLKGVQKKRTISDTFDQSMSGETLVDMMKLNLLVGSGGVLSHAPRRNQAVRMLVDSFLPEGLTELAVDSIFMMPQLGVLSSIHPDAAVEVFNKDCLIRLGTCIAPVGKYIDNTLMLKYEIDTGNEILEGDLKTGEIKLIDLDILECKINITPEKGYDIGAGKGVSVDKKIQVGEVGIILDGRGRPIHFNKNEAIVEWSISTKEFN